MSWDAAIIGGGPAGAAAACWLAEAGRRVVLFEREARAHHKVCGEFVSVEAAAHLDTLGLHPARLGAEPIGSVRLIRGAHTATAKLPFPAFSLSRLIMDEALLEAAADRGAEVRRGIAVKSLSEDAHGVTLETGETVRAAAALLATGKHELRGHRRPPGTINDLIGFKLHFRLNPEQTRLLAGHVEVLLFPGGYAGLQPVPGNLANLCLVVEKSTYDRLGRTWDGLLAWLKHGSPVLANRLSGAEPCWERPLSIFGIPYGFVHGTATPPARIHRLGDQLAVIPSFCGDGMAIALHSAHRAVDALLAGHPAQDGKLFAAQIRTATLLAQAIRHPIFQGVLTAACQAAPPLLRTVALATRIPDHNPAAP